MVSAINHTAESWRVIDHAEDALARNDVPEAAALIWDSAACAMRSIAESRGLRIEVEYDLVRVGRKLAREFGQSDIATLTVVAHTTPWLVDEGWINKDSVEWGAGEIKKLLEILDGLDIA